MLLYCIECNIVLENSVVNYGRINECKKLDHNFAVIDNKQYVNWVINKKKKLNYKLKEKKDAILI